MNVKKILAIALALVMLLSLTACALNDKDTDETGEKTAAAITVTIVHGDGTQKVLQYTTTEQYLGALLQAEGVIEGDEGPYGLEITKVDGEKAVYTEDKAYWALYENGEYALQGVDTTPIVDGGEYKLEYTPA